jgi:hypothetical protein
MNLYFGPLSVESCIYFKILTMFFFAVFVFAIIGEIVFIVKRFDSFNFKMFTNGILLLFNAFLAYFVNRLLYSMCSKSLA